MTALLITGYLATIIAANLITARFGPSASIYNAFALIGLSLTTRDRLHDAWALHRTRNMAALIITGSAISYIATITIGAGNAPATIAARIALASCAAFATAETADAIIYQLIHRRPWLERSNVSNILSATLDSLVFVWVAFGNPFTPALWPIVFGQICAKIAGGFLWSLLLARRARVTA